MPRKHSLQILLAVLIMSGSATSVRIAAGQQNGAPPECAAVVRKISAQKLVRIDRMIDAEICRGVQTAPKVTLQMWRREGLVFLLDSGRAQKASTDPPRPAQIEDIYVANNISKTELDGLIAQIGGKPYAGAGGAYSLLSFNVNVRGHFEITENVLRDLRKKKESGFESTTNDAIGVLRDAAQDADFYEWDNPAAHGQTGNADDGSPITGNWQEKWVMWNKAQVDLIQKAARAEDMQRALYHVGYLLHSVEDLACHHGRTNAEHSYQHFNEDHNPDEDEASLDAAESHAQIVLRSLRKTLAAHWVKMMTFRGELPSKADKERWHGHGWDFGPRPYWKYRGLSSKFGAASPTIRQKYSIRWCAPKECESLVRTVFP